MKMSSSYGEKQLQVIKNLGHDKYSIHVGAYGTGKTFSIEVALGLLCLNLYKRNIKGLDIVLLGKTQQTVKKNQCNVLSQCFGSDFHYDSGRTDGKVKDAVLFGQYIHIIGLNDKSSESKFRGISNLFCIIHDEAVFCTKEQFDAVQSRLRAEYKQEAQEVFDELGIKAPFYIGSTNPDAPTHFLKQLIDEKFFDNVVNWKPEDAKWKGSEEYYERLYKLYKEGSLEYKRYLQGLWVAAEGSIFSYFIAHHDEFVVDSVEQNEIAFALAGLDYGGNKSGTSLVITGFYRDKKKGIVVLQSNKLLRNKGEIDPEVMYEWILNELSVFNSKFNIPLQKIYCDNAEQYLEAGTRTAIRKQGMKIIVCEALKLPIMDRVKFIQRMMALGMFSVLSQCKTVISSLDGLVYDEKSLADKVLDNGTTDNDTWDGLSYSVESQINIYNFI